MSQSNMRRVDLDEHGAAKVGAMLDHKEIVNMYADLVKRLTHVPAAANLINPAALSSLQAGKLGTRWNASAVKTMMCSIRHEQRNSPILAWTAHNPCSRTEHRCKGRNF